MLILSNKKMNVKESFKKKVSASISQEKILKCIKVLHYYKVYGLMVYICSGKPLSFEPLQSIP